MLREGVGRASGYLCASCSAGWLQLGSCLGRKVGGLAAGLYHQSVSWRIPAPGRPLADTQPPGAASAGTAGKAGLCVRATSVPVCLRNVRATPGPRAGRYQSAARSRRLRLVSATVAIGT
ncbi:hypothetical protein NDU88_003786 [Pleurodeles waltl]|uniref:Uncharacterized protein n=1 Tax=Pleurodeles waltl TaxID=8319 RepID=A0AAV7V3E1_PLEWA|nr:hypothetical protein NDU88_003786 [Pleurodeles waltl]